MGQLASGWPGAVDGGSSAVAAPLAPAAPDAQQAWLAALVDSSFDAILSKSLDGTITSWNAAAERMYGYPAAEVIGRSIELIVPEDRFEELRGMDERLARGERVLPFETVRLTRDGRRIDVALTMSPIVDGQGRVVGASGIGHDITERRQAERQRQLLIEELNHRVKNTLATAQSLANQTLRTSPTPGHFVTAFIGRLAALATAHTVLADARWTGAALHELIAQQLAPYRAAERANLVVRGEDVWLEPSAALTLGLVLHELATNAAKHGALAGAAGAVEIRSRVRRAAGGRRLALVWRERGGPPVEGPARRGFGLTLIERGLSYQLGGSAVLEFRRDGLRCTIEFGLEPRVPAAARAWLLETGLDAAG
jgi:two-component system CheB/CheR fusion protein